MLWRDSKSCVAGTLHKSSCCFLQGVRDGISKVQDQPARKHNVVLECASCSHVVCGLAGVQVSYFQPQADGEFHLDRRSQVNTSAELHRTSACSTRGVVGSVDSTSAFVEKGVTAARRKP